MLDLSVCINSPTSVVSLVDDAEGGYGNNR
jgi:hypothetical protein